MMGVNKYNITIDVNPIKAKHIEKSLKFLSKYNLTKRPKYSVPMTAINKYFIDSPKLITTTSPYADSTLGLLDSGETSNAEELSDSLSNMDKIGNPSINDNIVFTEMKSIS